MGSEMCIRDSTTTDSVSSCLRPIITGTPFLIIPAFSVAIASKVLPKKFVWSKPILVIVLIIGVTIFVESKRPPNPVSITA